jgi:hypothetical protein
MEIFKGWDEEGKGFVTASNIKSVLANMNIKINMKESEVSNIIL